MGGQFYVLLGSQRVIPVLEKEAMCPCHGVLFGMGLEVRQHQT